jgi:hypothetical protein
MMFFHTTGPQEWSQPTLQLWLKVNLSFFKLIFLGILLQPQKGTNTQMQAKFLLGALKLSGNVE